MRFDVRLFVPISNTRMAWCVLAHILTFYLAAWGVKASLDARAITAQSIPLDIWSASLTDLLVWGGAVAAFYFAIIVSFANGVAPTLVVGQWAKTNSWPLPGLWMALLLHEVRCRSLKSSASLSNGPSTVLVRNGRRRINVSPFA